MKEIKITIPNNCELIKDGDTYVVKEKKQGPPRSWEEFCKKYPIQNNECFITSRSNISSKEDYRYDSNRHCIEGRNWCTSMEEARAFLALMQLRQLRKAWVGDWKTPVDANYGVIFTFMGSLTTGINCTSGRVLAFPTKKMAEEFLSCFKDLCETAKILL